MKYAALDFKHKRFIGDEDYSVKLDERLNTTIALLLIRAFTFVVIELFRVKGNIDHTNEPQLKLKCIDCEREVEIQSSDIGETGFNSMQGWSQCESCKTIHWWKLEFGDGEMEP